MSENINSRIGFSTVALFVLLAGCTDTILSEPVTGGYGTGLAYGLPRGMVQVKAERKRLSADDSTKLKKTADAAEARAKALGERLSAAKTDLELAMANVDQPSTIKAKLEDEAAKAKANVASLKLMEAEAILKAESARAAADVAAGSVGQLKDTVTLTVLPVSADPDARFVANLNHWYTRDDDLKLTVQNGLLASGTTTSTDRTPDIIIALAKTVVAFSGGPSTTPGIRRFNFSAPKAGRQDICREFTAVVEFDPTDNTPLAGSARTPPNGRRSLPWARQLLLEISDYTLELDAGPSERQTDGQTVPTQPRKEGASTADSLQGLAYRMPAPYWVSLLTKSAGNCLLTPDQQRQTVSLNLPDPTQTFVLPSQAGPFTKSVTTHAFKDGIPTEFSTTRPSEILAVANLPLDVARAIISVPTEILKLKVDYNNQAQALTEAQSKILQSRTDLLKSQYQLEQARADPAAVFGASSQ